ncbi:alpha-tubulin suppressor-like RCC1 family protein [Thermomonospora umbrina]|uniref:Alpha-tubulin suppressor-like RCC1 family protein n=1 Tax=Thermomonospora umbrina TaxID=111806 RepID=A0A3D9SV99_9ACTN|nr:alpha-tubulin suppressor-like RCC1 family protein [Thermomonospora umbrina]
MRPPSRRSWRGLAAVLLTSATVIAPVAANPTTARAEPGPVFDHGRHKGKVPGTRGPLPQGFSKTRMHVKFRSDRKVRLSGAKLSAESGADVTAIQNVLKSHPTARMSRVTTRSENELIEKRLKLEKRAGRKLPDLTSWYVIDAPGGVEGLLAGLNKLPAVEIAQAVPIPVNTTAPVRRSALRNPGDEPLREHQRYRNAADSPAGGGIDADYINAIPGGKGDGITVSVIETIPLFEADAHVPIDGGPGLVAAGAGHTLRVTTAEDGRKVWATGRNLHGELGIGTTTGTKLLTPIPGLSGVTTVAAAGNFSMALKSDGSVWTWGDNTHGQLGIGNTVMRPSPVQVPGITNAVQIAAGEGGHALAVLADGTVRAWGRNSSGQLGDGTTTNRTTPVTVTGLTGVATHFGAISGGELQSMAVLTDGTVKAWGSGLEGRLGNGGTGSVTATTVPGLTNVSHVSNGLAHGLARLTDGTIKAWGRNSSGQVGDGTTTTRTTPVTVPGLTGGFWVTAGDNHSVAEVTDIYGNLVGRAWGANADGQLGDGTTTPRVAPVSMTWSAGESSARTTVAGGRHTYTVLGVIGLNSTGQLGQGDYINRLKLARMVFWYNRFNACHEDLGNRPAPGGRLRYLSEMINVPCHHGRAASHGTQVAGIIGSRDDNQAGLAGIAPNAEMQVGLDDDLVEAVQNSSPGDVMSLSIGWSSSGKHYPWELNSFDYDLIVTATANGVTVVQAAGNGDNDLDDPNDSLAKTLMDRPDSGAIIVGAGEPPSVNGSNCLGAGRPAARTAIAKPVTWWGSTHGSRVNVQGYGMCVATTGLPNAKGLTPSETDPNKMYTGTFNGTSSATPIVAGAVAALQGAAKQSGHVLPVETVRTILQRTGTPQPAGDTHHIGPLPNLRAAIAFLHGGVAAGTVHTLGVKNDGTVWAAGRNSDGQLGDGTTTWRNAPVNVEGLTGVLRTPGSVAGGDAHSVAVKADGTVWAWGQNSAGQLGDGTTTGRTTPVQVAGLTGVVAVAAGGDFSLALKSDGTVWGWGGNGSGQLGDGTTTGRTTPVQATGLTGVVSLAARGQRVMAVRSDGTVRAWGAGPLGNGATAGSSTPVTVTGLTGVVTRPGAIAVGIDHFVAVKTDGTVWTWGGNANGQLGDGTTTGRTTPVQVTGLTGVSGVGAGYWYSLAVKSDGTGAAWGHNANGQLGNGTTGGESTTPVPVTGLSGATGIASGGWFSVANRADGTIFTWGSNAAGQLADGTYTNRTTPGPVNATP